LFRDYTSSIAALSGRLPSVLIETCENRALVETSKAKNKKGCFMAKQLGYGQKYHLWQRKQKIAKFS
jgi:hypothetical protein